MPRENGSAEGSSYGWGDGHGYGNGSGDAFGSGYGWGSGSGHGFGFVEGSGFGNGSEKERLKIEHNILKNIPDSRLPLYMNIWEFDEVRAKFNERLKGESHAL